MEVTVDRVVDLAGEMERVALLRVTCAARMAPGFGANACPLQRGIAW
jgi:hypothetical protein